MVSRLVASRRSPGIPGDLLVDYLEDAVAVLSEQGEVLRANLAFGRMLGGSPRRLIGHSMFELGKGALGDPRLAGGLDAARRHPAHAQTLELHLRLPRVGRKVLRVSARAIPDGAGQVVTLLVLHDATDEQAYATHRLELLELTHRVKNSLQLLAMSVARAARRAPNEQRDGYLEIQRRLLSVAALYDVLSGSRQSDRVDAAVLLGAVAEGLRATLPQAPDGVTIEVEADEVQLTAVDAERIGLLVNELATNALKHAFPDGRGRVRVALTTAGKLLRLSVCDDGIGLSPERAASHGSAVVASLAAALDGALSTRSGPGGASFEINFPWRAPPGACPSRAPEAH